MDRKIKQIVERLEGEARLTNSAGQQIATPHYWMVVWQAFQLLPRVVKNVPAFRICTSR